MMRRRGFTVWGMSLLLVVLSTHPSFATDTEDASGGHRLFENRIAPLLKQKCSRCHSHDAGKSEGGLMLDSRQSMVQGGESGPAIVPGDPDSSLLIQAVRFEDGREMPPDGKLTPGDIRLLEEWIRAGAVAPERRFAGQTSTAVSPEELWSFQPVKDPVIPTVRDDWPRTDVDRFVLARLQQDGLGVVCDAEARTLCRRLYFDLIGLPPTPEQMATFERAHSVDSQAAVARVVEELLATQQFGERWGRHWLDTARYAESNGNNRNRVLRYAWRYRNWVIDAFNQDRPYDVFLKEQIAGDLMPAKSAEQRDRRRIGTGFLAIGPKPYYPTIVPLDPEEPDRARFDWAAEQIDATMTGMMALTVGCARCHDHKFDPVPTRDYYALAGIFRSTNPRFGMYWDLFGVDEGQAQRDFLYDFNLLVLNDNILDDIRPLQAKYRPLVIEQNQIDLRSRHWPGQVERMRRKLDSANDLTEQQVAQLKQQIAEREQKLAEDQKRLQEILKLKQQMQDTFDFEVDQAMGVEDADLPADVHIRIAGEHAKKGDLIPRGFLSTLQFDGAPESINAEQSGRLELANWVAHPNNPLTARVAVNRIWYHLFGRGIVGSLDNFGVSGEPPTHPDLLDHLASRFVHDFKWSQKKLIAYLMTSRVYQLSSMETGVEARHVEVDPDAALFWRMKPRRLEAEAMRDAMLFVCGRLDSKRPVSSPVVEFEYYADIRHEDRQVALEMLSGNLRTIYVPTLRGHRNKLYELFDYPDDEAVNSARTSGNVPTQALYLLNNPLVMDYATALVDRLDEEGRTSLQDRLQRLYLLCFGRLPDADEMAADQAFLEEHTATAGANQAWQRVAHSFLISGEFLYRF